MRTIKVKLFQSLFDISVQEYGTSEGIVAIALANDISITDELEAETELKIPDFNTNKKVLKYFADNNIIPATAQLPEEMEVTEEAEVTLPNLQYDSSFDDIFG